MRCYFLRNGHIAGVVILEGITKDHAAIRTGSALFLDRVHERFEGFEIWDRERLVFRYPEDDNASGPGSDNGRPSSKAKQTPSGRKSAPWLGEVYEPGSLMFCQAEL